MLEAPKIVKPLKNAEVVEGGRVALEVEVTGKPKSVKWLEILKFFYRFSATVTSGF